MANKKNELALNDRDLFREAMQGVKKLVHTKIVIKTIPNHPRLPVPSVKKPPSSCIFSDFEKFPLVTTADLIHYTTPGVQAKTLRKLRLGQYAIEAVLDLHGSTVESARQRLTGFLLYCSQQAIRHVLIIHGKGRSDSQPILKNKLNHWLRQTEQVTAFYSARTKQGSTGALYVLLKR